MFLNCLDSQFFIGIANQQHVQQPAMSPCARFNENNFIGELHEIQGCIITKLQLSEIIIAASQEQVYWNVRKVDKRKRNKNLCWLWDTGVFYHRQLIRPLGIMNLKNLRNVNSKPVYTNRLVTRLCLKAYQFYLVKNQQTRDVVN